MVDLSMSGSDSVWLELYEDTGLRFDRASLAAGVFAIDSAAWLTWS